MLIIGEKINGTRKLVNKAVLERDAAHIRHLAVSQVEAGADVLDINAGTLPDREPDDIVWLIKTGAGSCVCVVLLSTALTLRPVSHHHLLAHQACAHH